MRGRRWAAAAGVAGLVALPVRAVAAEDLLRTPDGSPLAFEQLAPGYERTASVVLTNPSPTAAEVALELQVTTEEENGCLAQESRVATEGCTADGGELSAWLVVTVEHHDDVLWTGPLTELTRPRSLDGVLAAGATWELDLTLELPVEAGNDTMTDLVGFDLVAHVATAPGQVETEVLGVDAAAGGGAPTTEVAGAAAETGVPTAVAAGLAALVPGEVPPSRMLALVAAGLTTVLGAAVALRARRRTTGLR